METNHDKSFPRLLADKSVWRLHVYVRKGRALYHERTSIGGVEAVYDEGFRLQAESVHRNDNRCWRVTCCLDQDKDLTEVESDLTELAQYVHELKQ